MEMCPGHPYFFLVAHEEKTTAKTSAVRMNLTEFFFILNIIYKNIPLQMYIFYLKSIK